MRSKPGASTVFATSQYPGPGFELLNGFLSPATPKHIFFADPVSQKNANFEFGSDALGWWAAVNYHRHRLLFKLLLLRMQGIASHYRLLFYHFKPLSKTS